MAAALREVFENRKKLNKPVFVTFITAGFPLASRTVDVLLALEAGGADIIELGIPFTDPMADGIAIQYSNNIALEQNVDMDTCYGYVKEARAKGLKAPIIFMGYYNPLLQYGEEIAVKKAKEAGGNGFIVVDLPPEESVKFRGICSQQEMSFVPLIAPSTTNSRIEFLSSIADSFIYVVSKMGTTGASAQVSTELPSQLERIKGLLSKPVPLAVGFGVSTPEQFQLVGSLADGVVIGSKIISVLREEAEPNNYASAAKQFCADITRDIPKQDTHQGQNVKPKVDAVITTPSVKKNEKLTFLPPKFGEFGGQYVPEALFDCLLELEAVHNNAMSDPTFKKEFESYFNYMNRPSKLYEAKRLTEFAGGARIWFKREDLNHTGSHKINNAIGQILLAKRLGKTRIIAETGAGQHGVATATACAHFGLECCIYMGAEDVRRQALNVFRIKMLGAKVVAVASGSETLKDAINEALRDWVANLSNTHFIIGSAIGPHPFPTIVRDFQSVIGKEIKSQLHDQIGKLPDAVVACVGGGSNAIGTFYPFIDDKSVRLVGVEAGGEGIETPRHSATLSKGTVGVLHGVKTYILQDSQGQILPTHSVSAGLDYPGVGPEHSFLKDIGRAEYIVANNDDALKGFRYCTQYEGVIPALETSHAVWATIELAKTMPKEANIVLCVSGRGDKDVEEISKILPTYAEKIDWHITE